MNVVYNTPIVTAIIEAQAKAAAANKVIDHIALTVDECRALRREIDHLQFNREFRKDYRNSLIDFGRLITAGDTITLYGVKVVAAASEAAVDLRKAADTCVSVTWK